jgi:DNA-binding MarR family transcriptional regulator
MKKVHIKNIDKLIALRELLDKKLYSGHALITYDLILDILKAHLGGRNLTIKELCAGSIRSTVNTRKHIDLLIDDGWIEISNGIHDKRHRIVHATEKLIHLVDTILAPSKAESSVMNESMHSKYA